MLLDLTSHDHVVKARDLDYLGEQACETAEGHMVRLLLDQLQVI